MGLDNPVTKQEIARSGYNLSGHPVKDKLVKWISDVQSELEVLSDGVASASPQGVTDVSNSLSNVSSMQVVTSDLLSDTISSLKVVSDQASEISWQLSDTSSSLSNVSSMQVVTSDLLLATSNSVSNVSSMQVVTSDSLSSVSSMQVAVSNSASNVSSMQVVVSDLLLTTSNSASNVSSMQVAVSNSASNVSSMQNVLSNNLSDLQTAVSDAQIKFKSDFDVVSGGDLSDSCSDLWVAISDILVLLSDALA